MALMRSRCQSSAEARAANAWVANARASSDLSLRFACSNAIAARSEPRRQPSIIRAQVAARSGIPASSSAKPVNSCNRARSRSCPWAGIRLATSRAKSNSCRRHAWSVAACVNSTRSAVSDAPLANCGAATIALAKATHQTNERDARGARTMLLQANCWMAIMSVSLPINRGAWR